MLLPPFFDSFGLNDPWTYLVVFLGVSLLMMWRLEAMLDHGLECLQAAVMDCGPKRAGAVRVHPTSLSWSAYLKRYQ